jgi:septal ring-binding cell division protein DamX
MDSKPPNDGVPAALGQIQATLLEMQKDYHSLAQAVEIITGRVNVLSGMRELQDGSTLRTNAAPAATREAKLPDSRDEQPGTPDPLDGQATDSPVPRPRQPSLTSRIVLTTYPNQAGIVPVPMNWGAKDSAARGPVVVSHNKNTVRRRNGISSRCCMLLYSYTDGTISYRCSRRLILDI